MRSIEELISELLQLSCHFIDSLSKAQLTETLLDFSDDEERRRWYYTPTGRRGLSFSDMSASQRQEIFKILSILLTDDGYNHASMIIGMEHVLDHLDSFPDLLFGGTPSTRLRDPGNYRVAFFGSPLDSLWGWRIGGHHLAIHFIVNGTEIGHSRVFRSSTDSTPYAGWTRCPSTGG